LASSTARCRVATLYEDLPAAAALRDRSTLMTSGMIAKSRAAVDIAEFERFFDDAMIEQFHYGAEAG
jgi:hypothetical protein